MAEFCDPCERAGMPGFRDFAGWLAGRAGYAWAMCEGCGVHLLDDAGVPACLEEGGPLDTGAGGACPVCLELAAAVRLVGPTAAEATAPAPAETSTPAPMRERAAWPLVVTLCGSMRFYDRILAVAAEETMAGRIVLAPFVVVAPADQESAEHKATLDRLHLAKIDVSDRVIVVTDATGYIGPSTRRELEHATAAGTPVEWRGAAGPGVAA